jgi:hypothetical protein
VVNVLEYQGYQENRPSQQLFKAFIVFILLRRTVFLITLIKHAQQDAEPQNDNYKGTGICLLYFNMRLADCNRFFFFIQ